MQNENETRLMKKKAEAVIENISQNKSKNWLLKKRKLFRIAEISYGWIDAK